MRARKVVKQTKAGLKTKAEQALVGAARKMVRKAAMEASAKSWANAIARKLPDFAHLEGPGQTAVGVELIALANALNSEDAWLGFVDAAVDMIADPKLKKIVQPAKVRFLLSIVALAGWNARTSRRGGNL